MDDGCTTTDTTPIFPRDGAEQLLGTHLRSGKRQTAIGVILGASVDVFNMDKLKSIVSELHNMKSKTFLRILGTY